MQFKHAYNKTLNYPLHIKNIKTRMKTPDPAHSKSVS